MAKVIKSRNRENEKVHQLQENTVDNNDSFISTNQGLKIKEF